MFSFLLPKATAYLKKKRASPDLLYRNAHHLSQIGCLPRRPLLYLPLQSLETSPTHAFVLLLLHDVLAAQVVMESLAKATGGPVPAAAPATSRPATAAISGCA